MKYSVVCCDFPWNFSDELKMSKVARGASSNYNTMSIDDLLTLPIKSLIDPEGTVLAMWVPSVLLPDGLRLMKEYGFTFKQTYIWTKNKKEPLKNLSSDIVKFLKQKKSVKEIISSIKDFSIENILAFGMGHLFRQTHEICLIGISSNKVYKKLLDRSQRSVCFAENLKHSAKPEDLQDSLDKMFSGNKIELFARRQRKGWFCLGNEAPMTVGEDIFYSINKLSNLDQKSFDFVKKSINEEKDIRLNWLNV